MFLTDCVVYKATVTETYTGMTGNTFKDRWYGHSADMRNPGGRSKTKLSTHIWDLKDMQTDFEVEWDFFERANSFNPISEKINVVYVLRKSTTSCTIGTTAL